MGLDMYLERVNKTEVAYWRKANQIRKWFVNKGIIDEYDNGELREVSKKELEQLISDCKAVLEDNKKAPTLLPYSRNGFFFGMYEEDDPEYKDEGYYSDLRETIEMVEKVIAETDWSNEAIYYSDSW